MRCSRRWVFTSLLAIPAACLRAQAGFIAGRLTWRGHPLSAAAIAVYLLHRTEARYVRQWSTASGPDGSFAVRSLPSGFYVVLIRYQGRTLYQNKIQVPSGSAENLQVDLKS